MRTWWLGALVLAAGCTTMAPSPAALATQGAFDACRREHGTVRLEQVQADGSFTLTGANVHIQLVKRCMAEQMGPAWAQVRVTENAEEFFGLN